MPVISIIVPVYKVEKYIDKCINSILKQSFEDFELILIDDGSPDNCPALCDKYALLDDRIKVVHKKNGGLSSARNAGIDVAKGEFLGFIDSDDWIDNDMYEILYNLAIKYNADIVECSYRNITNDGIIEETANTGAIIEADNIFALDSQLDWKYFKSVAVNKIYHKKIFSDGKRYPVGKTHEDEFFTHQAFFAAKKLVYIDISKYNYLRTRCDSITGVGLNEKSIDACEAFLERLEFFKKNRIEKLINKMELIYKWIVIDRINQALNEFATVLFLNNSRKDELQRIIKRFSEEYQDVIRDNSKIRIKIFLINKALFIYKIYLRIKSIL